MTSIVSGRKTVECRLGRRETPPSLMVRPGDIIWLKDVSGPVRAAVSVKGVKVVRLAGGRAVDRLRREWNDQILAPTEFWRSRKDAAVATLIFLGELCSFKPFRIAKTDRRAWVPLAQPPVPGRPLRSRKLRPTTSTTADRG